MATMKVRVEKLETRVTLNDQKLRNLRSEVRDLQEWTQEEGRLRKLDEKRIAILEEARGIHENRFRRIARALSRRSDR